MSEPAYEISNTFALSSSATGTAARGTMLNVLRRRIIRHHCHMLSLGAFVCHSRANLCYKILCGAVSILRGAGIEKRRKETVWMPFVILSNCAANGWESRNAEAPRLAPSTQLPQWEAEGIEKALEDPDPENRRSMLKRLQELEKLITDSNKRRTK